MKTSLTIDQIKKLKSDGMGKLAYCPECKVKTFQVRQTKQGFWFCPECRTTFISRRI